MAVEINRSWQARLEAPARAELDSLICESDAELRDEALLAFAARQEASAHPELAGEIFSEIAQHSEFEALRGRARSRLEILQGGGPVGARAFFLLRGLAQQSSDPVMIGSMLAAGTVFRMTRLATLSRLSSASTSNILTRGFGARAISGLAGFALEAPTFSLAGRLGHEALGRSQDWSSEALRRDLASSYLVLGAMKATGWASSASYRRLLGPSSQGLGAALFHQGGMLSGILLGHGLEEGVGLLAPQSGANTLIESLAMLLQFNVAGRLSQRAMGPRWAAWEGGLDRQAELLAVPPETRSQALWRPAWAMASGERLALPNVLMMSGNDYDPLLPGPRQPQRIPTDSRETGPRPNITDPRLSLMRPRILRSLESDGFGDGQRIWTYELVMEPLENLLQPGAEHVVALRNGGEIRLRLVETFLNSEGNDFVEAGIPGYQFEVIEGPFRGELKIYHEADSLRLFSIRTSNEGVEGINMPPGAGTILIDWLASQAASRGQRFDVLSVGNPRIYRILRERSLMNSATTFVEAMAYSNKPGGTMLGVARLGDGDFLLRHQGRGFFNVRGFANPKLVPPELRSITVDRGFGSEGVAQGDTEHPYELKISPFRDFLTPGFEGVIAEREGRELRLRVKSAILQNRDGEFSPAGTSVINWALSEGGQEASITFHLTPGSFELYSIYTSNLPKGAGGIALDWMATQAAIHGRNFGVLFIENARIIHMLARGRIMAPGTVVHECFRCSYGFDAQSLGRIEEYPNLRLNSFSDFFLVRGKPNPALIPPQFSNKSE